MLPPPPPPLAPSDAAELTLLRQVLRNTPAGLAAVTGPEHRLTFCNARFQAGTGGRAQLGRTLAQCVPELVAQGFVALLDEVYRTGQAYCDHEAMVDVLDPVSHQVETRFYDLTLQPARDARGRVQGVTMFSANVTAQVQARHAMEYALAEQRQFYETLLREMPAGVVAFDAEHRYVWANSVVTQSTELADGLLGMTNAAACAARNYPPAVAEEREARFAQARHERGEVTWEETLTGAQGTFHWLRRMRPVFGANGKLRLMVASGHDITERRQAEARLDQQQALLQRVVDTVPHPVYVTDGAGRITFANAAQAAASQAVAQRRQLYRQSPDLVPEFQEFLRLEREVLDSQRELAQNLACALDSGEVRDYQVVMRPLPQPDGTVHVLTVSTDVTELQRAQRGAEAAARAQENFLATVSHEIRTPLNGVLGMAGLLAKTVLAPEQRHYLDALQQAGSHLLDLLNDVLDMAKINAGPLEFERAPFNLCASMSAAVQPLALQAAAKGVAFQGTLLSASCPHPWVLGDAHRLNQILLNLVGNAVKFTERGAVTVVGEQVSETADTLTVRFAVADTGIGIAPAQQARIFESFAQAHADTTRQYGGSGLGLSISRALVAQLGGSLTLESEVGRGSTFAFTLTLPKAPAQVPETIAAPVEIPAVRGWRVLLVDDNALNLALASAVLRQNGVVVDAAASGAAALDLFAEHRYAAVLMDVHMPGMSGLEATARIRRHPDAARAATPVLALTADAFRAQHESYRAAGMSDCITKPFSEAELLSKLATAGSM